MLGDLSELNPNTQLDLVLECLYEVIGAHGCLTLLGIKDALERKHYTVKQPKDIEFILRQLIIDGNVTNDPTLMIGKFENEIRLSDTGFSYYFITFPGKIFCQNKGYSERSKLVAFENNRIRALEDGQIAHQKEQNKIFDSQSNIQKKIAHLNQWIAFASVITAFYYLIQLIPMLKFYAAFLSHLIQTNI